MDRVNIITVTTAKGPRQQEMVGMFLVEQIHNGIPITKEGYLYREKIAKTEMTLQLLVNAAFIVSKARIDFDSVEIFTDEGLVESAFRNKWIENWNESGWKNAKGKDVANAEIWQQLYEIMKSSSKRFIVTKERSQYKGWMELQAEKRLQYEKGSRRKK